MKWGLGQSYDRVQFLSKKSRAYLDITKPASTLGVMGGYLIGSFFYFYYIGEASSIIAQLNTIIFVVVTMGLAHGASQAMNMAEDAEMDRNTPHKQNRPIPSGIITEEEARTLAWFAMLAAVGRAFLTDRTFGMFVVVLVIFGIFYNLSPIRAKERIISIPWQAASRGLLSFPTIWAAYGNPWQPLPWLLGVFMFFYVLGFQNSADIIDREVDEEYGIKTLIVVLGVRRTLLVALGATIGMVVTLGVGVVSGIVPEKHISLLLIIPFCAWMLWTMWDKPYTIDDRTGNHPAWMWFYVGMVLMVTIPLGTEILIT